MTEKKNILQVLEQTPAAQIPAISEVSDRFKHLYQLVHGNVKESAAFYEAEKYHFMKIVNEGKGLKECSKLSLYGCFLDVAVSGLSFDPNFKHLYIVPFNTNIGTQTAPKWEKRASLQISGYGELVLRIKQGQIKYADNPVLVYEGDEFRYGSRDGSGFVDHVANVPRKSSVIIAAYIKITRTDGTIDYKVLTQEDMNRFRAFSKDKESKAWTDGIGGMWLSKCIKHAFKNYPKVRTGKFTKMETDNEDQTPTSVTSVMNVPDNIDYKVEDSPSGLKFDNEAGSPVIEEAEVVDDNAFAKNQNQGNAIKKGGGPDDDDEF